MEQAAANLMRMMMMQMFQNQQNQQQMHQQQQITNRMLMMQMQLNSQMIQLVNGRISTPGLSDQAILPAPQQNHQQLSLLASSEHQTNKFQDEGKPEVTEGLLQDNTEQSENKGQSVNSDDEGEDNNSNENDTQGNTDNLQAPNSNSIEGLAAAAALRRRAEGDVQVVTRSMIRKQT